MGSLELGPEADVSQLEPLLTLENIDQLEATFVSKVQVSSWGPGPEKFCHQLCSHMSASLAGSLPCYILLTLIPSPRQVWCSGCRRHWMGK